MATSAFGNAIEFMNRIGLFEVVLPFMLTFTLVYAYMEKTKILGTDKWRGEDGVLYDIPRKNLNAMTAFVMAFFVVASTQLVGLLNEILGKVILVLVLVFTFTLVVGAFHLQSNEGFKLDKTWKLIFEVICFLAIGLIFFDALGWLSAITKWFGSVFTSTAAASVLMGLVMLGIVIYVVQGGGKAPPPKDGEDK